MLALLPGIALALLALAPGSASAQPLACGQTITKDTTLHADLGPCPGDGLVIGADNVTLDLNGHAILGNGAHNGDDVGVKDEGHDGADIENGEIRGFRSDVKLDANQSRTRGITARLGTSDGGAAFSVSGSYNSIENNVARGQTWESHGFDIAGSHNTLSDNASRGLGGVTVRGWRNAVTHNVLVDAEFGGLSVWGPRNLIAGNSVRGSESPLWVTGPGNVIRKNHSGIYATDSPALMSLVVSGDCRNVRVKENVLRNGMSVGCQSARIEGNTLFGAGIVLGGSDTLVRENTVSGAHAWEYVGIALHGGSDNSIVKNTISQADYSGIFVGGGSVGTNVEGNLVRQSGFGPSPYPVHNDDGIHVEDAGTVIANNRANFNFDLGIQAVSGVIDGGGNTAVGNGDPRQCLNVVCN